MNNVLYITYDGLTDPLGQSQVLPYLVGLSKRGYQITILSFEKKKSLANINAINAIVTKQQIHWEYVSYTKRPPIFSTLWDLYKMRLKARRIVERRNIDVVHCRSYLPSLIGQYLQAKFGIKFIFDMRGFWADERVEGDLWNLNNVLYRQMFSFFKKKETEFFREADHVVSLTYNGAAIIKEKFGNIAPLSVIPCCVDFDQFNKEKVSHDEIRKLSNKLDIPVGSVVLTYLGSIGTWYMLEEMLSFFKSFCGHEEKAIFLFITTSDEAEIRLKSKEVGVSQEKLRITSAAREEVPLYLSLSTWGIFFIRPVFSKKASSPTKQAEFMALGIPVIANAGIGDTDYILKKHKSGYLVDPDKIEEFELTSMEDTIDRNAIIEGCREFYSLDKGVDAYEKIYRRLNT